MGKKDRGVDKYLEDMGEALGLPPQDPKDQARQRRFSDSASIPPNKSIPGAIPTSNPSSSSISKSNINPPSSPPTGYANPDELRGRPLFTKHPSQRAMNPYAQAAEDEEGESSNVPTESEEQMLRRKQREQEEEEERRMPAPSSRDALLKKYTDAGAQTITFNVGGTFFVTTVTTLLKEPNTLFVRILDREEAAIKGNKNIFLDRNPKFKVSSVCRSLDMNQKVAITSIVVQFNDYLRTNSFSREEHAQILRGVMTEAEFFKIRTLTRLLKDLPELSRTDILKMINSSKKPLKLRGMWLKNSNLSGFDLSQSVLDFGNFSFANLRNTLLYSASISNAMFDYANVSFAVLELATMQSTSFLCANMSNCNMRYIVAPYTNFSKADLSHSNLTGADLTGCNLTEANLAGCDFTDAILNNADLRGAIFSAGTIMSHSNQKGADFEGSNVSVTSKSKTGTFRFSLKNKSKDKEKDKA